VRTGDYGYRIVEGLIPEENRGLKDDLDRDLEALKDAMVRSGLHRRLGTDLDGIIEALSKLEFTLPSSSLHAAEASGRAPLPGGPRTVFEKLVDAATVHQLCGAAPGVALELPRDRIPDPGELKGFARRLGIGVELVAFGEDQLAGLGHFSTGVREGAVEQLLDGIDFGRGVGCEGVAVAALRPGRTAGALDLRRSLDRIVASLRDASKNIPETWKFLIEEEGPPGNVAGAIGSRASTLLIVSSTGSGPDPATAAALVICLGKLGGLRLDGSIAARDLFLVLDQVVDAEGDPDVEVGASRPALLIGRRRPELDPIEEILATIEAVQKAAARALLVDRMALKEHREREDPLAAERVLADALDCDVRPLVKAARLRKGRAVDPIAVYRRSKYRNEKARERRSRP
jgi:L-rhamnose isomerase / sugar isomerase